MSALDAAPAAEAGNPIGLNAGPADATLDMGGMTMEVESESDKGGVAAGRSGAGAGAGAGAACSMRSRSRSWSNMRCRVAVFSEIDARESSSAARAGAAASAGFAERAESSACASSAVESAGSASAEIAAAACGRSAEPSACATAPAGATRSSSVDIARILPGKRIIPENSDEFFQNDNWIGIHPCADRLLLPVSGTRCRECASPEIMRKAEWDDSSTLNVITDFRCFTIILEVNNPAWCHSWSFRELQGPWTWRASQINFSNEPSAKHFTNSNKAQYRLNQNNDKGFKMNCVRYFMLYLAQDDKPLPSRPCKTNILAHLQ
jgi:hypothetical protein